ncbi:hypothetical protein K1T71_004758 [Dendrolimus kikuchii]|uniref:Uncharacterized protein n=1 Tax=Dendrolimus kikuchii TaxID=765133 RepID=A0ACC1D8G6_9NEOP|nr:hypothetical protein K1T71_004758 [Dendrolimus kikuchii]
MLVLLLLVVFIIWLLVQRWESRRMVELSKKIKMVENIQIPLVGHAYMFLGSDEDRMNVFQDLGMKALDSGGLMSIWQGNRLYIIVADPVNAEAVTKACLEKDYVMKCSRLLTGNGSVFAPVPIWRPRRKFLAPTFSPKNLAQFMNIFSRQSTVMVDQLQKAAGKGTFSIWKYITTYSMDSVCETTLGVRVDAQKQYDLPFLKAFERLCRLDSARLCQPWLHNDTVYSMMPRYTEHMECKDTLCGFIDKIIKSKRQSIQERNDENSDVIKERTKTFLELLIESTGGEKGYTDLELLEETLVLVLAGTDTSAVGTAFTTVMLSRHPDVQEKVYKEINEIYGDSDRPIVTEDLLKMKYLEAVIRETIRLYPPVPLIVRRVDKDVTLPSGITLVKDCGIVVCIWAINRNPDYWGDDALEFRPERFLNLTLKHPAAFMTFSFGPRGCIGYRYAMISMKTAVASIVRKYRIMPATPADSNGKHKPLRVKFDVMMKAVDNFAVQLENRV